MRITIDGTNVELNETMRESIERRLRFVLTRYNPQISRISLSVDNLPRPAGEFDACCKVCVNLIPSEGVETEAHDADIRSAVARAVEMAGRAVRRKIEQSHEL